MALLEELQRLQSKDRRISELFQQVTALVDAAREADEAEKP